MSRICPTLTDMTPTVVLWLALVAGADARVDAPFTRDAIEAMHAAMGARLKRDPAGVAGSYA